MDIFKEKIEGRVGQGEEIGLVELDGGYFLRATVFKDEERRAPDKEQDGFWPSLNPRADGYIGRKSQRTFRRRLAQAKEIMHQWENDDWWWGHVQVEVCIAPADCFDPFEEIGSASLSGVECNWPTFRKKPYDNSYLLVVANDLVAEALADAVSRGNMPQVIGAVLQTRILHSEAACPTP